MSSPTQMSRRRPPSAKPRLIPRVSQPQFFGLPLAAPTTPPGSPGRRGTYYVDEKHPPSAPKRKRGASGKKTKKTKRRKSRKSRKSKKRKPSHRL